MHSDRSVAPPGRGFLSRRMMLVHAFIGASVVIGLAAWMIILPPWG